MNIKTLITALCPPVLAGVAGRIRKALRSSRARPDWEYIPEGWQYQSRHAEVKGWNVEDVCDVYRRRWGAFVELTRGTGPLGISHESGMGGNTNVKHHNMVMAFAYALSRAAWKKDQLSFLDYGGGVGHYGLLARALFPDLDIRYSCKDLPNLVRLGRELLPEAVFFDDETCFDQSYDFVMASGALHYNPDWRAEMGKMAKATRSYLYIANVPTVSKVPSYVFVQRPYQAGYNTEYLGWCLHRDEFLGAAAGVRLVREFVTGYHPAIEKAPEPVDFRSFLFEKT